MPLFSTFYPSSEATPTLADLERYVQGQMDETEQANFEEQLAEDPLLADAVEGMAGIDDALALAKRLQQLRGLNRRRLDHRLKPEERQDERSKRKSRVRPLYLPQLLMGAAAVVLLMWLGINLFRGFQPRGGETIPAEESIADASAAPERSESDATPPPPPEASQAEEDAAEEPPESAEASSLAPRGRAQAATGAAADSLDSSEPSGASEEALATMNPAEGTPAEAAKPDPSYAEHKQEAEKPTTQPSDRPAKAEKTERQSAARQSQLAEAPAAASPLQAQRPKRHLPDSAAFQNQQLEIELAIARSLHERQRWNEAETYLQGILARRPTQPETLFLLGDLRYRQGKIPTAVAYLMRVSPRQQPWYDRSQWVLALCAEAQGNRMAARRILQGLSERPNRYQVAAQHLLKQWKSNP